jgi:hypothetical protein
MPDLTLWSSFGHVLGKIRPAQPEQGVLKVLKGLIIHRYSGFQALHLHFCNRFVTINLSLQGKYNTGGTEYVFQNLHDPLSDVRFLLLTE